MSKNCEFFLLCSRSSSPVPKVWKFTLSSASSSRSAEMQRGHFINQQNPFFRKLREDFSVEEAAFCYFLAFGAVFEDQEAKEAQGYRHITEEVSSSFLLSIPQRRRIFYTIHFLLASSEHTAVKVNFWSINSIIQNQNFTIF